MTRRIYPRYPEDHFVVGDLVIFTGYLYTPDYVYVDQYDARAPTTGIVIGNASGHYEQTLYRVYWLRDGRTTEVVGGHLQLAYTRK